jgi:hypothetical protein
VPAPEGMTGAEASTVYLSGAAPYPQLPIPATQYATAETPLLSTNTPPSVGSVTAAPVVNRAWDMWGYVGTSGRIQYETRQPQKRNPVESSEFQPILVGPQPNYILNGFLYRSGGFPAALAAGRRSPYLSTRVDQLVTRTAGGPGKGTMGTSQRRFTATQVVPRYSTMPRQYDTQSAKQ